MARKQMELEPGEAKEPVKRKGKSVEPTPAVEPAPEESAKVKKPRGKSRTKPTTTPGAASSSAEVRTPSARAKSESRKMAAAEAESAAAEAATRAESQARKDAAKAKSQARKDAAKAARMERNAAMMKEATSRMWTWSRKNPPSTRPEAQPTPEPATSPERRAKSTPPAGDDDIRAELARDLVKQILMPDKWSFPSKEPPDRNARTRSPPKTRKTQPKAKALPRHLFNAPTVPAVPDPATAIVGRGRGRPRKNPVDSTGNQEIKGKNNARTKKIKDKEYIATTAPVMGYYDVTNDAHMMKPKKIPAHIINAI
jgi:hypothetical protein